jgi:chromosome segregation ATPase
MSPGERGEYLSLLRSAVEAGTEEAAVGSRRLWEQFTEETLSAARTECAARVKVCVKAALDAEARAAASAEELRRMESALAEAECERDRALRRAASAESSAAEERAARRAQEALLQALAARLQRMQAVAPAAKQKLPAVAQKPLRENNTMQRVAPRTHLR